jgi:hypothetical protein
MIPTIALHGATYSSPVVFATSRIAFGGKTIFNRIVFFYAVFCLHPHK